MWPFLLLLTKKKYMSSRPLPDLQLGLRLGLLQDRLHLGRLHDVPPDLQLASHEESLGVGLARDEVGEVFIGEEEGDYN